MVKIGKLEVRTIGPGTKVVKLPGHEFDIEHFLPGNYESGKRMARAVFITSKKGDKPTFVKKQRSIHDQYLKLDPLSEVRLAAHINQLNIPGIGAEQPLAVIMHSAGTHNVIYRKAEGEMQDWDFRGEKAIEIENELKKHGIEPYDLQWFNHQGGITLFDLELFKVGKQLRKKLGLKYIEPTWD